MIRLLACFAFLIQIVNDLVDASNTWCDPKLKSNYLQFLSPHLSQPALQLLGCHLSWRSFKTSRLWRLNHETVTKFEPKCGRPALDERVFNAVYDHLFENSRVAANRISIKHSTPFRHLSDSISQLYLAFNDKNHIPSNLHCSESTFRGYVKEMQIFTDPSRDSDMCNHCQNFRRLRKRITALNRSYLAAKAAAELAAAAAQNAADAADESDGSACSSDFISDDHAVDEESALSSSFHSSSESSVSSVSSIDEFVDDDDSDDDSDDDDIDIRARGTPHKKGRGPPSRAVEAGDDEKHANISIPRQGQPNITDEDAVAIAKIQQFDTIALKRFVRGHDDLTAEMKSSWIGFLTEYETLSVHRHCVKKVNRLYFDQMTKTPAQTLILTMDFKQNLVIGNKQIEVSSDFRKNKARTVLGFYACTSTERKYIDYVSDVKSHTGFFVKQCLRDLFHRDWFVAWIKRDNIHTLLTWADNAGHFKTHSMLYMIMYELLYELGLFRRVRCAFFVEYHGKSLVDGHFGLITKLYNWYCSTHEDGIHTTAKLCEVIRLYFEQTARIKLFKKTCRRLSTIMKMRAMEDTRPLSIVAVNFDLNRSNLVYTQPLRARLADKLDLQYRLVVPDIKSWGVFEAERERRVVDVCNAFKQDTRYHKKKKLRKRVRLSDGSGFTRYIWVLRGKGDIVLKGADDTLDKWCNRVAQKRSGYTLRIRVNDTPADPRRTQVELPCHLSVVSIPPITRCKSPECKAAKTSELDRKRRARGKHRSKAATARR